MKHTIYGMLFLLSACDVNSNEQPTNHSAIDQIFAQWDQPPSPGCALAVIQDGEIIYSKGYGMADLEHDIPITPESIFYAGSVSKQFVAMCMLLLEEQGNFLWMMKCKNTFPNCLIMDIPSVFATSFTIPVGCGITSPFGNSPAVV